MILMIIIMVSVSKMERMDIMWMILFSFLYLVEFFLMYLLFVWIEKKRKKLMLEKYIIFIFRER